MGVSHLWQLLREEGLVATWKGNEGQHTAIAPEIDGQAVAVDLSLWLMQASSQPDLIANFPNPEERCLKVAFERASNWLRYGCVPVGVVEGRTPPEKLERLQQRFRAANGCAGGGGGSSQFIRLGRSVGKLLESMGLPVVYAPGEAEASCAALNRHGYVDGCATADGDVLVFGAQTVYHTLKLQTAEPGNAELVRCCMADVRRALGLKRGGQLALLAVGLLTGGDYDTQGATNVGHTYAMSVVRHLLQGKEDDLELLKDLRRLLGRPPDAELQALGERGCTGCKRCKHEGHMKGRVMKHHKRNPCAGCHMAGDMCELRAEAPCECEFHRREMERFIDRAVRRVRASDAFAERAAAAQRAYLSQADVASASAHDTAAKYGLQAGDKFTWLRRPDVDKMYRIMDEGHLRWNEQLVRQKTLPLLIDWDVSHPPLDSLPYAPPAASGEAPAAARVQFAAASIAKVHGLRSQTDDASKCWRYLLNIERLDVGPDEVAEADREWLKKADSVEKRAVRMSAVRRSQPQLVEAYEQGLAAKADAEAAKKARAAERAQKKLLKEAASAGASAKSSQSAASKAILANFIKQSKPGVGPRRVGASDGGLAQPPGKAEAGSSAPPGRGLGGAGAGQGLAMPQQAQHAQQPQRAQQQPEPQRAQRPLHEGGDDEVQVELDISSPLPVAKRTQHRSGASTSVPAAAGSSYQAADTQLPATPVQQQWLPAAAATAAVTAATTAGRAKPAKGRGRALLPGQQSIMAAFQAAKPSVTLCMPRALGNAGPRVTAAPGGSDQSRSDVNCPAIPWCQLGAAPGDTGRISSDGATTPRGQSESVRGGPGSSDGCREDDVDDFAILGSPSKRQQTPNAKSRLHGASRVVDADGDSAYPDSTQRPVRQGVARALLAGPTPVTPAAHAAACAAPAVPARHAEQQHCGASDCLQPFPLYATAQAAGQLSASNPGAAQRAQHVQPGGAALLASFMPQASQASMAAAGACVPATAEDGIIDVSTPEGQRPAPVMGKGAGMGKGGVGVALGATEVISLVTPSPPQAARQLAVLESGGIVDLSED